MELYDVIIIGGGPGGLSAAYAAYENGAKKILVLAGKSAPKIIREDKLNQLI